MSKTKRKTGSSSRIHCRISPALKEKVETAAELCGQSITAFTEVALAEKAQEVLRQEERIQLSQSAFEAFLEVLEAPPNPPSSKLLNAIEDYKRHHSS
jgi:uncharacterized protein (DUF1778 family)